MSSIFNPRKKLGRWLHKRRHTPAARGVESQSGNLQQQDRPSRIRAFMAEAQEDAPDWFSRLRLISFAALRERFGPHWSKLKPKIDLLAEKIIAEDMFGLDRFMEVGDAEFLVFYADATHHEILIRSTAVIEEIETKLFGIDSQLGGDGQKLAQAHPYSSGHQVLDWETGHDDDLADISKLFQPAGADNRQEDIATSAQTTIDSIITDAMETDDPDKREFLSDRLAHLSRSLSSIQSSLLSRQDAQRASGAGKLAAAEREELLSRLQEAMNDTTELAGLLSPEKDLRQQEILQTLANLRWARAERAAMAASGQSAAPQMPARPSPSGTFGYLPVYRSTSTGDQVYQGIFRIGPRGADGDQGSPDLPLLEEALRLLGNPWFEKRAMLMVPVRVGTLSSPFEQRRYSTLVRAAEANIKRKIVVEVCGYPDMENSIFMRRTLDELRTHFLAVFVVLPHRYAAKLRQAAKECKKAGIHALGVDVAGLEPDRSIELLNHIGSTCAEFALHSYVSGIDEVGVLAKALATKIDYVCAPGLVPALPSPGDVCRASFEKLYSLV
jgi:hypothetical protein